MFNFVYDEKRGVWRKIEEPFAMIEIDTERDYGFLYDRLEKQIAKKPLGVDLHGKASGNIHKWVCPICENFLVGRATVDNAIRISLPDYCCVCGQKLDWSEVTE